ncbi:B3 domain-containing protein Os11g0197600 isoform X2 [Brachypodium distachyon]|uniref:TF-B3 domain-containing protein n=1 Tax=Brachypodium distachyon TaxID=15368 RepID=A0A2K2CPR2_BRADI|nr:B3 domain-containing protein Os11g0197600 isoform X2 [Brachypodium distachyon]PNT63993.1 hypothetical protein BRADI_4g23270v3 [Brachypodium distachyon]|eukprot:XP_010237857.1 B3 domain-containing protein Os11g0197600 isoform X2 [Brachypodium distachyon]
MARRQEQGSRRREQQERERRRREELEREESTAAGEKEKEKEKEKEESTVAAAMVATEKENGEDKEKEKEGEEEKFGQQFFRVFLPQQYGERLRIPLSFNQYLRNQPAGMVSLKGQSGNIWLAELAVDTEGLFFANGWKEFVRDHSIETGHFLTFRYDGRSKFSVVVFDGKCIEKPSAFHARPCKDLIVKLENGEGDMGMNATDPSQILVSPLGGSNENTRERVSEMDANGTILQRCSSVLEKGKKISPGVLVGTNKTASTSLNKDMSVSDQSESVPNEESIGTTRKRIREMDANGSTSEKCSKVSEMVMKKGPEASVVNNEASTSLNMDMNAAGPAESLLATPEDSNGTTRKRVKEINVNDSTFKKCSSASVKGKEKCPVASVGTYKSTTTSRNSTEESDSESSMLEQSISSIKAEISSPMRLRKNKDVPKCGKCQRQLLVISQRPPVTEEQKNHALQRAKKFKSKNPFALQIMKESYVYVGFFMNLPCGFVRDCLPRANKKLKLWDPQGKSWDVNYVYYSARAVGAFSGGWSKFSLGNNLEKFDICVFELISKDDIKVHIYRVVPEITPFLPGTNRK